MAENSNEIPVELKAVVQKMLDAGESEENIAAVIRQHSAPTEKPKPEDRPGTPGRSTKSTAGLMPSRTGQFYRPDASSTFPAVQAGMAIGAPIIAAGAPTIAAAATRAATAHPTITGGVLGAGYGAVENPTPMNIAKRGLEGAGIGSINPLSIARMLARGEVGAAAEATGSAMARKGGAKAAEETAAPRLIQSAEEIARQKNLSQSVGAGAQDLSRLVGRLYASGKSKEEVEFIVRLMQQQGSISPEAAVMGTGAGLGLLYAGSKAYNAIKGKTPELNHQLNTFQKYSDMMKAADEGK